MDPLSITAGIIGVATAAMQSTKALYDIIDSFNQAPDVVARSKTIVLGTQESIDSLKKALTKQPNQRVAHSEDDVQYTKLEGTLRATEELCENFAKTITKYTKRSTESKFSNRDRILFTLHEPQILKFNKVLNELQQTIGLLTGSITLQFTSDTAKDVQAIRQKLSTGFQAQEDAFYSLSEELSARPANSDVATRRSEGALEEHSADSDQLDLELTTILRQANRDALAALQTRQTGQTFGDMHTDQSSTAMQGEAALQGGGNQSFGKLKTIHNSRAFQGRMDGASFAQFFK